MSTDKNALGKKLFEQTINVEHAFLLPDGSKLDVPVTGNLGLLATGYKGLFAWRKKRLQQKKKQFKKQ